MCQSKAEGGRRCYSHALPSYKKAKARLTALASDATSDERKAALATYDDAVRSLAATPTGRVQLRNRAVALEGGGDADGDDLDVIRGHIAAPGPSQTALALAEAMSTRTPVPVPEGNLASARTVTPRSEIPVSDGPYAATWEEAFAYGRQMDPNRSHTRTPRRESDGPAEWAAAMRHRGSIANGGA